MINWQSILSSFDDKPTLLEWLKKVQKALNESALTTVTVTQEKAGRVNSITLTFNFQDGTKIVAPAFTVSDGKDGTGITDLIDTNLTESIEHVTYDTRGLYLTSIQRSTYLNGRHTNTLEFRLPIMVGNGLSMDVMAEQKQAEIKIDTSLVALKSELAPMVYRHLLKCTSMESGTYHITAYSSKSDAITTDYVKANPNCLIGAISVQISQGAASFDRIIEVVDLDGPPGYIGIKVEGLTPAGVFIKIDTDDFALL